jgi:hypothetical protein
MSEESALPRKCGKARKVQGAMPEVKPMGRAMSVALMLIFMTGTGFGQKPDVRDEHEDPIIQNLPDGKKEPLNTPQNPAPKPTVPQESKPKKTTSRSTSEAPVGPPLPTLNSDEAILGTWDLVLEKSKFNPGPGPRAEVRTYVKTPDGILVTVNSTDADNSARTMSYPWQVDGKEHPVTGSKLLDSILLAKVDNLTSEATMKHGDIVIASERREFAADGKTMTIEVRDMSSTDHPISSRAVYQKR